MPHDPAQLAYVMTAVVAALAVFSLLILGGVRIVAWLHLPQELPEGPRFEPPPPEIIDLPDPSRAASVAQRRGRLREIYGNAYAAFRAAGTCHEALAGLPAGAPAPERKELQELVAAVDRQLTVAEASLRDDDLPRALLDTGRCAQNSAEFAERARLIAERHAPADHGRRRVIVLGLALLVALWLMILAVQLRGH